MWCRDRGRRPRRPVRPMAFPCTCRAVSAATSATLPCPARNGPAPPRSRQARPSRARHAMDPRRLGRDKRDPPVRRIRRVTMWCRGRGRRPRRPACPMAFPCTCRAASVATSATLPCAVSAGLPCGAVVGADVLGGPRVRWHLRLQTVPKINMGRICWNSVSRRCYSDDAVAGWSAAMRRVSPQPMAPRRAEGRCEAYQNQIRLCSLPPTGKKTAFGSSTYVPLTVRSRRSSCAYLRWFRPRRAIWRRREQP